MKTLEICCGSGARSGVENLELSGMATEFCSGTGEAGFGLGAIRCHERTKPGAESGEAATREGRRSETRDGDRG